MRRILSILIIMLVGCKITFNTNETISKTNTSMNVDGKMFTSLYQQKSAEYKALCYQAYNLATIKINMLPNYSQAPINRDKPWAVVTDIDETVLDNSAYAVHQGLLGKEYDPQSWYEWSMLSAADSVPGAPAFFKYAASKGVEVFYITNRLENERASTLKNLQKFGLPFADEAHLLLKTTTSGKEPRRQQVAATHNIALLIGDNLADFSSLFDKKSAIERENNTNISRSAFGDKFIVIPNPVYGDWEGALFNYNYKLSISQKDSIYKTILKSY